MDASSLQKIVMINESIGIVYAGMGPDSTVLVKKACKAAHTYFQTY